MHDRMHDHDDQVVNAFVGSDLDTGDIGESGGFNLDFLVGAFVMLVRTDEGDLARNVSATGDKGVGRGPTVHAALRFA